MLFYSTLIVAIYDNLKIEEGKRLGGMENGKLKVKSEKWKVGNDCAI